MDFKKYWEIVEVPVYIVIGWSAIGNFLPMMDWLGMTTASILGWLVLFGAFGYIGHKVVKANQGFGFAAGCGAFAGVLTGLAGAVIAIITFQLMPDRFAFAISKMVAQPGITEESAKNLLKIGLYIGIISGPVISAGIGAFISMATAWIIKKTE